MDCGGRYITGPFGRLPMTVPVRLDNGPARLLLCLGARTDLAFAIQQGHFGELARLSGLSRRGAQNARDHLGQNGVIGVTLPRGRRCAGEIRYLDCLSSKFFPVPRRLGYGVLAGLVGGAPRVLLRIVCRRPWDNRPITTKTLAASLELNPGHVRLAVACLKRAGLVQSSAGDLQLVWDDHQSYASKRTPEQLKFLGNDGSSADKLTDPVGRDGSSADKTGQVVDQSRLAALV